MRMKLLEYNQANIKRKPRAAVEFPVDGLHQIIVQLLPVIYQANKNRNQGQWSFQRMDSTK